MWSSFVMPKQRNVVLIRYLIAGPHKAEIMQSKTERLTHTEDVFSPFFSV